MKRNTLNIIILTLAVINLVLNILIIFSVIPTANKTNNLISKISAIIDLEIEPIKGAADEKALTIDQIDTRNITSADGKTSFAVTVPGDDGKQHYVVLSAAVSLDKTSKDYAKLSESFDNAMSLMASKVDMVISSYTYETALAQKEEMRVKILNEIKTLFNSDMIYDVSFTSFNVQ